MNYDEIERLAAVAERQGGYAHIGGHETDIVEILGDDRRHRLEGRSAFAFLQHMLRRSQDREAELRGVEGYGQVSVEQAQRDARREVLAAVEEAVERFK